MNRREVLKGLCILAGSSLLPIAAIGMDGEPRLYDEALHRAGWTWDETGLMSYLGQSFFPMYDKKGNLMTGEHSGVFAVYYYRGKGVVECETKTYPEIMQMQSKCL